jgi:hypothetical protein
VYDFFFNNVRWSVPIVEENEASFSIEGKVRDAASGQEQGM